MAEAVSDADGQFRFENAALAVLARVLRTGMRIDLAVTEHMASHPVLPEPLHFRPDLIICVADCRTLVHRLADKEGTALFLLAQAEHAWRRMQPWRRLAADRRVTRIQAAIGNLRRAIEAVSGTPPSPRS
jgi:hypothetical protein